MNVILENFRSFAGRHEIELRPLTILTGENSTGKTSFLAALSLIFDPESFPLKPKFNREPYALGGYDTIARSEDAETQATSFALGFDAQEMDRGSLAEYREQRGKAVMSWFQVKLGDDRLTVEATWTQREVSPNQFHIRFDPEKEVFEAKIGEGAQPTGYNSAFIVLLNHVYQTHFDLGQESVAKFSQSLSALAPGQSISLAPVRTSPKRTYERVNDEYHPAGRHVPSVLANAFREPSQDELREDIRAQIQDFGSASGLFDDVRIRNLGDRPTDPFQVEVQRRGRWDNVVDVGYGVGQVLPILIEALTADASDLLLIQQPEVHLHPRAQAELGSFLARTIAGREIQVVLETHSDYIVDRIRAEIAEDTLDADDAQLLFFEKEDLETTVHRIPFDGGGNVVDPPSSYRRFFLQEEISLLSRSIS
jgi:predicted ATPase